MKRRFQLPLLAATLVFSLSVLCSAQQIEFKRDIAPILENRCWDCHNAEAQEGELRLDTLQGMLQGGGSGIAAILPGNPERSYLIEVISHLDPDLKMPPEDEKLPEKEIELLRQWIQQGAKWPGQQEGGTDVQSDHWSFQPIVRAKIPNNKGRHNPIDAFLLASLEAQGLGYSKPAEASALLRRASIVLTGLMPTPDETDTFLSSWEQDSERAYTNLINRLMSSPHFGERWAQHWLDVIRWAETNGSEANLYRKNAWVYRDYVVRAFNEDKPYNQFIHEQIAGDSLGSGEATGFLVSGPHVPAATVGREPAAIRQARADRMDEIIQTVGASVMGVTIGCARCHNHKFDPISLKDYYALTAIFQDVEFGGRQPEYATDHPLRRQGDDLLNQIEKLREKLKSYGGWEENWGAYRELHFPAVTSKAIRIRFKTTYVGLDELEAFGPNNLQKNLALPQSGTKLSGFPEAGIENRNPLHRVTDGEYGTMTWRARVLKDAEQYPYIQLDFKNPELIDRLRLSSNREYYYDTDYLEKMPTLPRYEFDVDYQKNDGSWQPWIGTWYVNKKLNEKHPERQKTINLVQQLITRFFEEGPQPSFVGRFIDPPITHVLLRGSPESPRDEVNPAGIELFQGELGLTSETRGANRRLAFANWLTGAQTPLTARVMVNRIWHHIFGTGIVATTGDFGSAGAIPSHPELLEWLAAEFMQPTQDKDVPNWSMHHMIRMMVMSKAFRQTGIPNQKGITKDANTRLLWRFPPKRVEAEVIRDSILLASGKLQQNTGGKSYRIHNEKKTYAQWEVVNNHGPHTWRRMLYQERMRRVDDGIFTAFDFPDCGQVRAKRPVSTTPLQALNLLNSPFVLEQTRYIAERALARAKNNAPAAIENCFKLILGRTPAPEELSVSLQLMEHEDLALVCRALINSNEFAFLP
ncbi:MAG: PSD1 and planctomycete cytochrome C domain-containing protein [Planctomycetota bacterium]|nr:PSD1 and planctomycete cytochrome C domain-containing protein [Planctomycetota bacterium]